MRVIVKGENTFGSATKDYSGEGDLIIVDGKLTLDQAGTGSIKSYGNACVINADSLVSKAADVSISMYCWEIYREGYAVRVNSNFELQSGNLTVFMKERSTIDKEYVVIWATGNAILSGGTLTVSSDCSEKSFSCGLYSPKGIQIKDATVLASNFTHGMHSENSIRVEGNSRVDITESKYAMVCSPGNVFKESRPADFGISLGEGIAVVKGGHLEYQRRNPHYFEHYETFTESSLSYNETAADYDGAAREVVLRKGYTISASANGAGVIAPAGENAVYGGDSQTYTITPNADYLISDVKIDGVSLSAEELAGVAESGSYTFEKIADNHTIEAFFALAATYYSVSLDSCGGSAVDALRVEEGKAIGTLPTPVRSGYTFNGWFTQKGGRGAEVTDTTVVTADMTLYASWIPEVKSKSLASENVTITVKNGSKLFYNGSTVKPAVTVKDGKVTLTEGVDYMVSYRNNINASSDASKASVIIRGMGDYTGSKSAEFAIQKRAVKNTSIEVLDAVLVTEGTAVLPKLTVVDGGKVLTEGTDYTVAFEGNDKVNKRAKAVITGAGNYTGAVNKVFKVYTAGTGAIAAQMSIVFAANNTTSYDVDYTGKKQTPEILVTDISGNQLTKNKDYTVKYSSNQNAGVAKVVVKGKKTKKNNGFTGTRTLFFTIHPVALCSTEKPLEITGLKTETEGYTYTGKAIQPKITVKNADGKKLKAKSEYVITCRDNRSAGIATLTITGVGKYTGEASLTFAVKKKDLASKVKISGKVLKNADGSYNYSGVKVKYGTNLLVGGVDYKIVKAEPSANGRKLSLTIAADGLEYSNYAGTLTKNVTLK